MKVGFIGFGRMGGALAQGAVRAGVLKKSSIIAYDSDPVIRKKILSSGFRAERNILDVVSQSNFVFLCVKPQVMDEVLREIERSTKESTRKKICFVSIAAGIPISRLQKNLGSKTPVLRVMPNTPALLGAGMSGISRGKFAKSFHEMTVKKLLSSVGKVVSVSESLMDAVTAVSGSGPAYVFYLAEAMMKGGRKLGLSADVARQLVHQTLFGAGTMLAYRSEPAEELRRQVTSPGGTTAAAMKVFKTENFMRGVERAVMAAAKRSKQLSKL